MSEARAGVPAPPRSLWRAYGGTLLIVAGCTAIAELMHRHFDLSNLTMVFLLGVVVAATAFGRGPAIAAAVLGVLAFDVGFVPPRFTLGVSDAQYLVTFAVMLVVAVVIGTLTAWLRAQAHGARLRERRTVALYRLSHDLAVRSTTDAVIEAAVVRVGEAMDARVVVLLPDQRGQVRVAAGDAELVTAAEARAAAQRTFEQRAMSSWRPHDPLPLMVPLEAGIKTVGVLVAEPIESPPSLDPERLHLLRNLASQTALALERCRLVEDVQRARTQAETERARSALLSSVSHDLRTPLAAITGAATSLRDDSGVLAETTRRELADTIAEEAQRLNRLIGNLLDMTRLESGNLRANRQWHSVEEVVGAALARLETVLGDRDVRVDVPSDLPLVPLDDVLFEQLVWNLVENAHKYSPAALPIELAARAGESELVLEVADRGPGIEPSEAALVFEKFYRGAGAAGHGGVGLGLAICRGIVAAHGGSIEATPRPGGGTVLRTRIPIEGRPPVVEHEALQDAPAERVAGGGNGGRS